MPTLTSFDPFSGCSLQRTPQPHASARASPERRLVPPNSRPEEAAVEAVSAGQVAAHSAAPSEDVASGAGLQAGRAAAEETRLLQSRSPESLTEHALTVQPGASSPRLSPMEYAALEARPRLELPSSTYWVAAGEELCGSPGPGSGDAPSRRSEQGEAADPDAPTVALLNEADSAADPVASHSPPASQAGCCADWSAVLSLAAAQHGSSDALRGAVARQGVWTWKRWRERRGQTAGWPRRGSARRIRLKRSVAGWRMGYSRGWWRRSCWFGVHG